MRHAPRKLGKDVDSTMRAIRQSWAAHCVKETRQAVVRIRSTPQDENRYTAETRTVSRRRPAVRVSAVSAQDPPRPSGQPSPVTLAFLGIV